PDRAAERDQVVGQRPPLRPGAAMHDPRMAIVRVVGGEQTSVVPLADELLGKGLDVPPHPTRIRIRVRRDQSYAHCRILAERPTGFRKPALWRGPAATGHS